MINVYLILVLLILVGDYLVDVVVEWLNLRHGSPQVPEEFRDVLDEEKYATSRRYQGVRTRFHLLRETIMLPLVIAFILLGGFNWADRLARSVATGEILTGLIFAGIIAVLSYLVGLPFSLYSIFGIEQKFGFNKMTWRTFLTDQLKGLLLGAIIGGILLAVVIWFFLKTGEAAWIYAWAAVMLLQLVILYLAPLVIMPLFNKFEPLPEGELRHAIEEYARRQGFQLSGIYTMDGSRRSTKANAYFTGFGRYRRIVLFDTLVEKHTVDELMAVLAHEMGHFKKKHIHKLLFISALTTALLFFLLSLFIENEGLFAAFRMERTSIYASLFFIGFLYSPIATVIGIVTNALSRRFEFEADAYSADTFGKPEALIDGLKKLSVDNSSDLTPHPAKVFLEYSHPPVLQRVRALRAKSG